MREKGFYWVFGLSWSNNPSWFIARWDGHYFWSDGDDYSEASIMEIDERQIVKETYCLQSKVLIEKSNLKAK